METGIIIAGNVLDVWAILSVVCRINVGIAVGEAGEVVFRSLRASLRGSCGSPVVGRGGEGEGRGGEGELRGDYSLLALGWWNVCGMCLAATDVLNICDECHAIWNRHSNMRVPEGVLWVDYGREAV